MACMLMRFLPSATATGGIGVITPTVGDGTAGGDPVGASAGIGAGADGTTIIAVLILTITTITTRDGITDTGATAFIPTAVRTDHRLLVATAWAVRPSAIPELVLRVARRVSAPADLLVARLQPSTADKLYAAVHRLPMASKCVVAMPLPALHVVLSVVVRQAIPVLPYQPTAILPDVRYIPVPVAHAVV